MTQESPTSAQQRLCTPLACRIEVKPRRTLHQAYRSQPCPPVKQEISHELDCAIASGLTFAPPPLPLSNQHILKIATDAGYRGSARHQRAPRHTVRHSFIVTRCIQRKGHPELFKTQRPTCSFVFVYSEQESCSSATGWESEQLALLAQI